MKLFLVVLLAFWTLPVFAARPAYRSLQQTRSSIQIPKYTLEQKKLVLGQARLILEQIYVHQEDKTKTFGSAADPIPALNAIESQLQSLSTMEFHQRLSDIFYRLRDLHALYYLPKPYACYESFLPFELKEVTDKNGKKVIAISDVGDDPDVLKYMPKPFDIKVGDVITKYDGLDIEDAITSQLPRSLGATAPASRRNALKNLKFLQHSLDFLPTKDSVQLEILNSDGVKYETAIPWITWTDWSCVAAAQTPEYLTPVYRSKKVKHRIKVKYSKTRTSSVAKMDPGHTDEPVLYWQINRNAYGKFGYLELVSFTPDVLTVEEVLTTVKEILLQDEMKNTDGLMIELRGNTGGQLPLAERLVQFFSPQEVAPEGFYLKNSPANLFYFNTIQKNDPFTVAINRASSLGLSYTSMLPITARERLNDQGQIYFKPIAVFTSSACYSACETFASHIQDNKLGTIFGEDETTGGGGANTYSLNEMLEDFSDSTADSGPFKKLPYGQNITFAWREGVRGGINKGLHIENTGVKSDRLSSPAMSDLFNRTNDQLLVLQKFLKGESPKYTSNIYLKNEDRQDFEVGTKPSFTASWNNTNTFVFKQNGKATESRSTSLNAKNQLISYPTTVKTNHISQGRFEMQGFNGDTPVWRKVFNYRVIPKSKVLAPNERWTLNLIKSGDVSTYTINTPAKEGWNISDKALYLGDGKSYGNDSIVEASVFATLPNQNYKMHFDATIETEESDILQILAISKGKTTVLLDKISGNIPFSHYTADLGAFANKAVELRFVFKSDPEFTLKGITITNLMLAPE